MNGERQAGSHCDRPPPSIDTGLIRDKNCSGIKTRTVSEAKAKLGELADSAIQGKPTVIVRGGKLVILQAYELPDHPDEFDALIQAGKDSPHRPLDGKVFAAIWKRGRAPQRRVWD